MLPGIVAIGHIEIAAAILDVILPFASLVTLVVAGAAIALVYLAAVLAFGLNGFDRGLFASYLPPTLGIILLIFPLVALRLYLKPLFAINVAYNKVRIPGIVTFYMGIENFLLAVIPYITGWNYYGVALAGAVYLHLKTHFSHHSMQLKYLGSPEIHLLTPYRFSIQQRKNSCSAHL